ncbi:unnamed protein product [Calypogeia fissa]
MVSCLSCSHQRRHVFPTGKLIVTVHRARGIKGDEMIGLGKADPYAEVKLGGTDHGGSTAHTPVARNAGSDPVWNHPLIFPIRSKHEEYNELSIVLFNKNLWSDKQLGEISIKNIQELSWNRRLTAVPEEWHRVSYKENVRGEVLLS